MNTNDLLKNLNYHERAKIERILMDIDERHLTRDCRQAMGRDWIPTGHRRAERRTVSLDTDSEREIED